MPTVRVWTLESDNDARAVGRLANKLVTHLRLRNISIQESGRQAVPKRNKKGAPSSDILRMAVRNYLKQDTCVIFVIDSDSPMSTHQRQQEPNSLINQVTRIIKDSRFTGKVFLARAVQEVEAWLLVDCLGIFCYFASKVVRGRRISRGDVLEKQSFARLVNRYQKGDTEKIVEAEIGGSGAKEYLVEFSEKILRELNPNMPPKNIKRQQYKEHMSPEVAEQVVIDRRTLKRNNSLRKLGDLFAQFQQAKGP